MHVSSSKNTRTNEKLVRKDRFPGADGTITVKTGNIIDAIRLPFRRDRQFYRSFYTILGFYPRKIELYRQALTHKSALTGEVGRRLRNNERLEYLGDAILGAVVSDILYNRFRGKREGFLTSVRSKVVQRETLGRIADEMGLAELLRINRMNGRTHNSYLTGNAFEALIGAIYLDRGYEYCKWFVDNRILGRYIDLDKIVRQESNFKSRLLEWCQRYHVAVAFEVLEETMETDTMSPRFLSRVTVSGMECGRGIGYSKKESHQAAAKEAMRRLHKDTNLKKRVLENENKVENGDNTDNKTLVPA